MSANLLLHSLANFRGIIFPALKLAGARRIVEIGSEYGTFTQELCAYATQVNGQFISIDPKPQPVALEFIAANQGNPHFQFIQAASIEALPKLEAADAYIVDGDHNYFTVASELKLVAEACAAKPVLIFAHDVSWPWGRRDLYYAPDTIPDPHRQPYTMQHGVALDNPGTVKGGFRGEGAFGVAFHEGGEANGVLTAIEDFIAKHTDFRLEIIPAIFGLGVIYNPSAAWAETLLARLRPYTQNPLLAALERNRLELYLKVIELQDKLAQPAPQPRAAKQAVPFPTRPATVPGTSIKPANGCGKKWDESKKTEGEIEKFVATATRTIIEGLEQHKDAPELWNEMSRLAKDENRDVFNLCVRNSLNRRQQRSDQEQTAFSIITALAGYHAGVKTLADLRAAAEAMLLENSQSALVTGFHFHVLKLTDPENPIYQLENFVCQTPFEQLDVLSASSHLCCASWLHESAGNMAEQDYRDVWNSPAAANIRQSVLDGSYRYCNKNACPYIAGGRLSKKEDLAKDPWWADVIQNKKGVIDRFPKRVNLAYDRHCNLSCPSCRNDLIATNDQEREKLDAITQRNIHPLLTTAEEVYVTGSGDPFASRTFRKLLKWISDETCPHLSVRLMTNGLLFTEKEWAKFKNLRGKMGLVKVSVDGARKETHELLRRGSHWETMMENLLFIGTLLKKGEIEEFEMVFIVQRENYREMGDFVDLAANVGANRVYFERITNWGTFTPAEYQNKAVFNNNHPEFNNFLNVMKDERLRRPEVMTGSLAPFLPAASSGTSRESASLKT